MAQKSKIHFRIEISVIKHDLYGPLILLVITACITKCYGTALSHLLLNILPQNYHLKDILRFYKFLWKLSHKNAIKLDFAKIRGGLFLRKAADQFPVSCGVSPFFSEFLWKLLDKNTKKLRQNLFCQEDIS